MRSTRGSRAGAASASRLRIPAPDMIQYIDLNRHEGGEMDLELAAKMIALIATPIGAVWALLQWGSAVRQRKREFRWQQVDMGRRLLDELFDDPVAGIALELIDGELDKIQLRDGTQVTLHPEDIHAALSDPGTGEAEREKLRMVRRSFDALLYYLQRIERAVALKLVKLEDVSTPTSYYALASAPMAKTLESYTVRTGYRGAGKLLADLRKAAQSEAMAK